MKRLVSTVVAVVAFGLFAFADETMEEWFAEDAATVAEALEDEGETDDGVWSNLTDQVEIAADRIVLDADDATPVAYRPDEMLTANAASITLTDVAFDAARGVLPELPDDAQAAVAITTNESGTCVFAVANDGAWEVTTTTADPAADYAVRVDFTYTANGNSVDYSLSNGTEWVTLKSGADNPVTAKGISTVEFAGSGSFATFSGAYPMPPKGTEGNPWQIGAGWFDDVAAWTNANGRLEISGSGKMQDFGPSAPWAGDTVTEAIVGAGVESIGANAFAGCKGLKTLVMMEEDAPPELADGTILEGVQIFVPAGAEWAYCTAWPTLTSRIFPVYSGGEYLVSNRLYQVEYGWWDAQGANDIAEGLAQFLKQAPAVSAGDYFFPYQVLDWYEDVGVFDELTNRIRRLSALCTSCRTGNFIGRNFDWAYDDVEECVMRVPAADGRFASIGIASRFFPEPWQSIFGVEEFLPELTMDGINEKGVAINVNVVPAGDNGATTGTNPGGERLCAGFAVRHVLDAATNAAHAVEILESKDIYSIPFLEFHWMVSDSAESYIVECVSNKLVVLRAHAAQPKMANFYVSHSPSLCEYDVLTNSNLTAGFHTPHAMGIERYARVSNGLDRVDSVDAMFTNMTNVWYKLKYLPGNEGRYWSDLNGAPVPGGAEGQRFTAFDDTYELCVARSNAFKSLQANYVAVTNYEARNHSRTINPEIDPTLTNQVVHTVHTSLYDLEKRTLRVCVQEDCQSQFDYALDSTPPIAYRAWDEKTKSLVDRVCSNAIPVTANTTVLANGGWYAVMDDVEITGTNLTVSGAAHLILCDGATLTVTNVPNRLAAIEVSVNGGVTNVLSIYGQTAGTGGLNAFGGEWSAGIGGGCEGAGGTVTINGGTVTAASGNDGAGIGGGYYGAGGTVTINGGAIEALGGCDSCDDGAGIGGGFEGCGGAVTINGGAVTATGGGYAAGIGGGYEGAGGTVTINGGTVTATGGYEGAGIGGGEGGAGGTVTVTAGTVTAVGGDWAAGIGGGLWRDGGAVTINGGTVTAVGGEGAAGVGRGHDGDDDGTVDLADGVRVVYGGMGIAYARVKVTDRDVCEVRFPVVAGLYARATVDGWEYDVSRASDGSNVVTVEKGEKLTLTYSPAARSVTLIGESVVTRLVQSDIVLSADELPSAKGLQHVHYRNWTGSGFVDAECDAAVLSDEDDALLDGCWYAVTGDVEITGTNITVSGAAHLILCDGAILTVTNVPEYQAAIDVSAFRGVTNALSIYGQKDGAGGLNAFGGYCGAGIGGGYGDGGTVTINGGSVTAVGGEYAAGIGGAYEGDGGTVTINDGVVTAIGGKEEDGDSCGAGVGGGFDGAGGEVTINGGTVTAVGGGYAAGIGGYETWEKSSVVFGADFAGGVLAGIDAAHVSIMTTDEYVQDHSAAYVALPASAARVPQVTGVTYVVSNGTEEVEGLYLNGISTYVVEPGESLKLYFVLNPGCDYKDAPKANPMDIGPITGIWTIDPSDLPTARLPEVGYLDWDGEKLVETNTVDYEDYRGDFMLAGGKTYVVRESMTVDARIKVNGTTANPTRFILCDDATLTATKGVEVAVTGDGAVTNALIICGQTKGSGALLAMVDFGGFNFDIEYDAGIGGREGVDGSESACGVITINGGTVMATGNGCGAGIGGGSEGAGGTVTINGGTVTATGGVFGGAGIGGGYYGAGGAVTINGGEVTATGGGGDGEGSQGGAGIGGGDGGAGGTVTISGGAVTARGKDGGKDIGHGYDSGNGGTVTISGGLFWKEPENWWTIVTGYKVIANPDTETKEQYPYAVVPNTVPLAPGFSSDPFDSEAEAQAAIDSGAITFAPAPAVEAVLKDSTVFTVEGYKAMFAPVIYPSGDQYRVMYDLNADGTNDLNQSIHAVVTNIDLAAIAAAPAEDVDMALTGGLPGFYYTLFTSAVVADVTMAKSRDANNSDVLCDKTGTVTFKRVKKPSDAAGFFTVTASPETPFTEKGLGE